MIPAYDRMYLEKARLAVARMLDFAVYELHFDIDDFFALFLESGLAARFGEGDCSIVVGRSGVELAFMVMESAGLEVKRRNIQYPWNRSPEYWAGWALVYYQWSRSLSFGDIVRAVPLKEIVTMYSPFHEMDIRHFCDQMDERMLARRPETSA